MSAKPLIAAARWADGVFADKTAPTSGDRDIGFQEGDAANQSFMNELLFQYYQWALYVSDGVFSGDVALSGSLTVGGQLVTFVDFTYTADSTTDRLTRTAHGLLTGYGPVRSTNSGGALPSGIVAGVDYFVIRVDADHIQLAASRADALAGFALDFLTNGTGTQTLVHQTGATLPTDAVVSKTLAVTGAASLGSARVGGAAFAFPIQVFTANSGTDQLGVDGHGLQTGWGPMRVSNSGGALPAGLLAATDYWVIRVNSGKFSLASSFANAMAGTAIDLTTAGTGTNSIVAGTTPVQAGSQTVHGSLTVDGNLIVIGKLTVSGKIDNGVKTISLPIVQTGVGSTGNPGSQSQNISGGTNELQSPICLPVGVTILACRADIRDSATGPTKLQVQVVKALNGTTTSLGTSPASAGTGAQQTIALVGLAEVVASGWGYHAFVNFNTGSASSFINQIEVDYQ